jgi:hypothetical protein
MRRHRKSLRGVFLGPILSLLGWPPRLRTETIRIPTRKNEVTLMKSIHPLTRPKPMVLIDQGLVLDILEKQLRNAIGNLDFGNKSQEE